MTDKEFCKIYTGFYGEEIDKVTQLVSSTFTGEELKEYTEHVELCSLRVLCEDLVDNLQHDDKYNYIGLSYSDGEWWVEHETCDDGFHWVKDADGPFTLQELYNKLKEMEE